jgi:hypothetical protein
MGNIFSGTSTTSISDNYVQSKDASGNPINYVKNADIASFINKDVNNLTYYYTKSQSDSNYAKSNQIPDLTPYAQKTDLTSYAQKTDLTSLSNTVNSINTNVSNIQSGNYLSYSGSSKNTIELSDDYLQFTKNGNQISKLNKDGSFEITNLSNSTLNSPSIQFKRTDDSIKQTQILGIQSGGDTTGNEKRDFLRIGSFKKDTNNNYQISPVFVRFDTLSDGSGSPVSRFRSPVIFNNNLNIGQDSKYYTISTDFSKDKCISLKETDQSNSDTTANYTDKPVGKWCP